MNGEGVIDKLGVILIDGVTDKLTDGLTDGLGDIDGDGDGDGQITSSQLTPLYHIPPAAAH